MPLLAGRIISGRTDTWLITMVIVVVPSGSATWDPFQLAELHGFWMGVILTTYVRPKRDDPQFEWIKSSKKRHILNLLPPKRGIWGFPKIVGFPNKPIGFPTKNDQHLGCDIKPPFLPCRWFWGFEFGGSWAQFRKNTYSVHPSPNVI